VSVRAIPGAAALVTAPLVADQSNGRDDRAPVVSGGTQESGPRLESGRGLTPDAMLVSWTAGQDAPVYAEGTAKRIPAGGTLIFQVHYRANGTPGTDRSKVGLVFAREPPRRELRTSAIANTAFAIPPNTADYVVEAEARFGADVHVWSMHPHMHVR